MKKRKIIFILFSLVILSLTAYTQDNSNVLQKKSDSSIDILSLTSKDIPFDVIDEVPVFPGCKGDNVALRKCLNLKIRKHLVKSFNGKIAPKLNLQKGRHIIYVQFRITTKGRIKILGSKAPHYLLANEAERVVKKLPKMAPGKHNDKPVNVTYMLPISFNVK